MAKNRNPVVAYVINWHKHDPINVSRLEGTEVYTDRDALHDMLYDYEDEVGNAKIIRIFSDGSHETGNVLAPRKLMVFWDKGEEEII